MAFAYMKTHNLWLPVLIHFMNNFLALLFNEVTSFADGSSLFASLGTLLVLQILFFAPFLFSRAFRKQEDDSNAIPL